jgi:hypothetical protein
MAQQCGTGYCDLGLSPVAGFGEHCKKKKISIFSDIEPFSSLKINQRIGGTCRFHLQD